MASNVLTRQGLAYRYLGPHRYECTRCRRVTDGQWPAWRHVCVPNFSRHALGSYNPSASLNEQYEALSLAFAALAAEAAREEAEVARD